MALHRYFQPSQIDGLDPRAVLVEIGGARRLNAYEKTSTAWFDGQAERTGRAFYSVDMSDDVTAFCREKTQHTQVVQAAGETFLAGLDAQIGFLYLDNADVLYDPQHYKTFRGHYEALYQGYGRPMLEPLIFNRDSALIHLRQAEAALPLLADHCYVGLDDTYYDAKRRRWWGKGALVAPLLILSGFDILVENRDGVLFARPGSEPNEAVAFFPN